MVSFWTSKCYVLIFRFHGLKCQLLTAFRQLTTTHLRRIRFLLLYERPHRSFWGSPHDQGEEADVLLGQEAHRQLLHVVLVVVPGPGGPGG